MNYISIAILLLIIFFYSKNKDVYSYQELIDEQEVKLKLNLIKKELLIIDDCKELKKLQETVRNSNKQYVIVTNVGTLEQGHIDTVITNYIKNDERLSTFVVQYFPLKIASRIRNLINNINIACLNYINIMGKKVNFQQDIIIGKSQEFLNNSVPDYFKTSSELSIIVKGPVRPYLVRPYLDKRYKLNFNVVISVLLTLFASTIITANLAYNIVVLIYQDSNLYNLVASIAIYFCYSNIHSKIYKSMGKFKIIASYFFPIYVLIYIIITLYYFAKNVAKKISH